MGGFSCARSQSTPTEAEILANFKAHKSVFRKLAQMAQTDEIYIITQNNGEFSSATANNADHIEDLSAKRVQEYADLMRQVGVTGLFEPGNDLPLCFRIAGGSRGLFNAWSLGFAWSKPNVGAPNRATPLVVSVYQTPPSRNISSDMGNFTFSKIEPNWFLYRNEK